MTRPARSRSTRRCRWPARCPATAGCSGSPRARRSARSRRCSPRCAAPSTPAPPRRMPATASRPSWPSPTPALVEAAAPAVEALELLLRPLVALGKRLEAVIEDAPDWLDAQARARVEGAIGGLAWRVADASRPGSRSPRGSAARPIPISSTGSRSSGSRAANMMSACTATGSIRPGRSPRRC